MRAGRRRDLHPGRLLRRRDDDAIGAKFAPKFISSTLPDGLESLTYVDGHAAARPQPRPRSTRRPPTTPASGSATGSRSPARRRARDLPPGRADQARRRLLRRRQHRPADPARGAADHRQARPLRPDLGRRRRGGAPTDAEAADRAGDAARRVLVETGAAERRPQLRRDPRRPRLPADRPARLRLRRPLRRRLPDLQHLLDHRRPAGHASSGCCARSAPRAGRSSPRSCVEALAIGVARRAARARSAAIGVAKGLNALFDAIGIDLPTTAPGARDAHGRRLAADRHRRHPGLLARPGAALDPGAADRRAARRSSRRAAAAAAILYAALAVLLGVGGLAMVLAGLFGDIEDSGTAAGLMGGGAVADPPRRLAVQPAPGAAAGLARRLAAGAAARPDRPPRPREHAAQPGAHRGHRGGADDRARAGHLRHRLRRRDQELDRHGRRRQLPGRAGDPEHRRLLADPAGARRRRRARCPGSRPVSTLRSAQAKVDGRRQGAGLGARPGDRRPGADRIDWKEGGPATLRGLARRPGDRRQVASPPTTTSSVGDRVRLPDPDRQPAQLPGGRRVRGQGRPARQRRSSPSA